MGNNNDYMVNSLKTFELTFNFFFLMENDIYEYAYIN